MTSKDKQDSNQIDYEVHVNTLNEEVVDPALIAQMASPFERHVQCKARQNKSILSDMYPRSVPPPTFFLYIFFLLFLSSLHLCIYNTSFLPHDSFLLVVPTRKQTSVQVLGGAGSRPQTHTHTHIQVQTHRKEEKNPAWDFF